MDQMHQGEGTLGARWLEEIELDGVGVRSRDGVVAHPSPFDLGQLLSTEIGDRLELTALGQLHHLRGRSQGMGEHVDDAFVTDRD